MAAWGQGGSARSCESLLQRVERNDTKLVELVILPIKNFTVDDVNRLSQAIASGENTSLKSISASGHSVPPKSLQLLGSAIVKSQRIYRLAIGDRAMGDDGVIALCLGLQEEDASGDGCPLQELDLCWKNISSEGMKELGKTFSKNTHLCKLDLSRNETIDDDAMHAFLEAAAETAVSKTKEQQQQLILFPSLEQLDLSECTIGPAGVQALSKCLLIGLTPKGENFRQTRLDLVLSSNSIGQEGCRSLSHLLYSPSSFSTSNGDIVNSSLLSSLSLSKCDIGDDGLDLLVAAAKECGGRCDNLKMLDLSNNDIGSQGAEVIGEFLLPGDGCWNSLEELRLNGNQLGGDGVVKLTRGLVRKMPNGPINAEDEEKSQEKNISALKTLDLSKTDCGSDGASIALQCTSLTSLRLFNNQLGSEGFSIITPFLRGGHPSIVNLDLGGNNAKEEAVVGLLRALLHKDEDDCSALRVLEIGGNEIGDEAEEILKKLEQVRPELDIARDKPKRANSMADDLQSFTQHRGSN